MIALARLLMLAALALPGLLVPQGVSLSVCLCAWFGGVRAETSEVEAPCCRREEPACCATQRPAPESDDSRAATHASCSVDERCAACLSLDLDDLELAFELSVESPSAMPALGLAPVDALVSPATALSVVSDARAPPEVTRTPAERAGALPLRI